ncbi:MAG: site-2 protease family protein [Actinobacteria bacterium]|jgi:membrane-associated protease RseP (regulator of RpoE activity)|nr:site-2 protease family protein [Actinomycetota bacterium]
MSFLGVAGVIAFVVALLFSVMVHEAGHFLTARRFDMKVTEFFLGFGKRIWSFTRGETEFGIKAIPAGGYCRIVGMSVNEEMEESDRGRAFYLASAPKRLIVLGAGSFLHFVLGFLILVLLLAGVGTTAISNKVGEVVPCIISNSTGAADAKCAPDAPPSPAKAAGLMVGDEITAINGAPIKDWSTAVKKIRNSPNQELSLTIKRGSSTLTVPITPGTRILDGKKIGIIGVSNTLENRKLSIYRAVTNSGTLTWDLTKSSVTSLISLPTKIPALFRQTFFHETRDATGLVGVVGVARVSAQTASDPKLASREKIATFLLIIASLNIFVGLFNLLPLLPLDGGHMAIAVIDGLRRARARRKGSPAPPEIDVERLMPLTMAVFAILAVLSLLLLAADIFNPINLNQ